MDLSTYFLGVISGATCVTAYHYIKIKSDIFNLIKRNKNIKK